MLSVSHKGRVLMYQYLDHETDNRRDPHHEHCKGHRQGRSSRFLSFVALASIIVGLFPLLSSDTYAYDSRSLWYDGYLPYRTIYYSIDPNLDALLSRYAPVSGSANAVQTAVGAWNNFRFQLAQTSYPSGISVSARDFQTNNPCIPGDPFRVYAVNCTTGSNSALRTSEIFFNSSANYYWNTSGGFDCNVGPAGLPPPWQSDVYITILHELGHSVQLSDFPANHPEAVMYFTCDQYQKTTLREDDKTGPTMLYGIRTNWENGFASGEFNTVAYAQNVTGYPGIAYPELGPRLAEFGATPFGGVMELLAGTSTNNSANYSYAYMRLFSYANDSSPFPYPRNYLTIRPGMHLIVYHCFCKSREAGLTS